MQLSSLTLRILSSLVLIPIVITIIAIGGWVFAGLAALCIGIALAEWVNITKHIPTSAAKKTGLYALGIVYLAASYAEMITLNRVPDETFWTIVFMLCIWGSDSGAYLFGKTIGGPKMSPTISPNKTWSGYAGALLFPCLVLYCSNYFAVSANEFNEAFAEKYRLPVGHLYPTASLEKILIGGTLIGIAGQSGDLMISALKRKAGLKDTGALIPGHGGILDRIDALLLALPVFISYIKYATH